jgi:hypothetical protein
MFPSFIDLHNLWFVRPMSLVSFICQFKVKGLTLDFGHVMKARWSAVPTTQNGRQYDAELCPYISSLAIFCSVSYSYKKRDGH